MRWIFGFLLLLLGLMQYRLWVAEGSRAEQHRLLQQVSEQEEINRQLQERNAVLEREVLELQSGNEGVEQRAREQLGLIREGEVYYQFVDEPPAKNRPARAPAAGKSMDQPGAPVEPAGERP